MNRQLSQGLGAVLAVIGIYGIYALAINHQVRRMQTTLNNDPKPFVKATPFPKFEGKPITFEPVTLKPREVPTTLIGK